MTTPLPQDLRRRIVRAAEKSSSIRQAAARYEVSPSAAVKLMRRLRETDSTRPDRVGGHRRPVLEPHHVGRDPDRAARPRDRGAGALDHSSHAQAHGPDAQKRRFGRPSRTGRT